MISLRFAVLAVLVAASFAGCLTYFVTASRRGSAIAGNRAHFDRSHQRNTNKY
jgi:hypothetical protein